MDHSDHPVALHRETAGSGRRIVLAHGFTQTGNSWRSVVRALGANHEVIALDMPDHGGSGSVHATDIVAAAGLVGAAGGRATYVGYSMGGRVCLQLATDRPDLVERLVLVSTSPGIAAADERAKRRKADEALADRLDSGLTVDQFLTDWLSQTLFTHLTDEQADLGSRLANSAAGLANSLRTVGTGAMEPLWGRLGALAAPTLIVAGADDRKFVDLANQMAAAIGPLAKVAVMPGTGHACPFEDAAGFSALVAAFAD